MRALPIDVFESKSIGNCSNHGISEKYDEVLLICDDGFIDVKGDEPNLVKVVVRNTFGRIYKHVEPVAKPDGVGWMFGGTLVYSSDSRFHAFSDYPLALHDRCESQKMYDELSR